jgi:uncharacterized membrane protein
MNTSQIHLALTHLPVVLSLVGMIMLIVSLVRKNPVLSKTSFYLLFFAGLAALPVFFSGEGAEETVEHLPGVSESLIEEHEDFAKIALFAILATALIAFIGLLRSSIGVLAKPIRLMTLMLALASSVLLAQTAHLGGQIRHTEIRPGATAINGENNETGAAQKDDD